MVSLELWTDSFHEGEWFIENLKRHFSKTTCLYIHNFIPQYTLQLDERNSLSITIFGSYKSWENIPSKIEKLLELGKPDIVLYDRKRDTIIIAIEETAAVPTGNQALQRCERIFGSAYYHIPFAYLLPEYGMHKDGGVRRTSIWPTLLALKLSLQFQVPSISLLYSDIDNPEDYSKGTGLSILFEYAFYLTKKHLNLLDKKEYDKLNEIITSEIINMCAFVVSQWENIIRFFPDMADFSNKDKIDSLCRRIMGDSSSSFDIEHFLHWPLCKDRKIPNEFKEIALGFINEEAFLKHLDGCVMDNKGYVISEGAGSKPQTKSDIKAWLKLQEKQSARYDLDYKLPIKDFKKTKNGNYHITTSKNITYLIDTIDCIEKAYKSVFPARNVSIKQLLKNYDLSPVFLYVCNSLTPRRMFGDPFTGQFSAFSNIFCYSGSYKKTRTSIIYLPYQSAGFFYQGDKLIENKGMSIYTLLADLIICNNGYVISLLENGKLYGK